MASALRAERASVAQRGVPVRTCVACRRPAGRDELVRLVEGPTGQIAVDVRARAGGRGAWVHATRGCIGTAARRHAAERALKVPVRDVDEHALLADFAAGMRRRIASLVGAAHRKRALAVGAQAVSDVLERTRVPLVLLARDAGSVSKAISEPGASGGVNVRTHGTRDELGAMLGRNEVAILAVIDPQIAVELATTMDRLSGAEG
jgi:predicted RNA-binding protein YlxR (DUF448 family)/ribosomal protein L7Ae-like RNA K-turn-binding protein